MLAADAKAEYAKLRQLPRKGTPLGSSLDGESEADGFGDRD